MVFWRVHDILVISLQEKLSYIALDYDKELKNPNSSDGLEKAYELPDGQVSFRFLSSFMGCQ